MSKLLRRPTLTLTRAVTCFYCQTEQQPRDARSFRCLACSCWNRYDKKGQIMSDDPAMYDASLNTRSFARRGAFSVNGVIPGCLCSVSIASPRKDRLPSMYSQHRQSLFCHECQTNQMLISNLLSNYLPSQDVCSTLSPSACRPHSIYITLQDPDYNRLLAQLPAYQSSLETRYPPICANCLPAVEEEIKRRDNMARTSALGGFLKESRGKERQRQVAVTRNQKEALERQLVMWKVRGVLWGVTLAVFLIVYGIGGFATLNIATLAYAVALIVTVGHSLPQTPSFLRTISPVIVLVSISWTAWDPTYASLKRSQLQGRAVRQRGKKEYNVSILQLHTHLRNGFTDCAFQILQFLAWVSRIFTVLLISVSSHKPSWDFLHFHSHNPLDTDTPSPYSPRAQWYFRILLALELIVSSHFLTRGCLLNYLPTDPHTFAPRPPNRPSTTRPPHATILPPPNPLISLLIQTIHTGHREPTRHVLRAHALQQTHSPQSTPTLSATSTTSNAPKWTVRYASSTRVRDDFVLERGVAGGERRCGFDDNDGWERERYKHE